MEVNVLILNKKTLNSGYIFFDNQKLAKQWESLIPKAIGKTHIVQIKKGKRYYGIKMFYTKRHVMMLGNIMKDLLTTE